MKKSLIIIVGTIVCLVLAAVLLLFSSKIIDNKINTTNNKYDKFVVSEETITEDIEKEESNTLSSGEASNKLHDYCGSVVVGMYVKDEYFNMALNSVKEYITETIAVYIFDVSYDREGVGNVAIVIYDETTAKVTSMDITLSEDNSENMDLKVYREEESNQIKY